MNGNAVCCEGGRYDESFECNSSPDAFTRRIDPRLSTEIVPSAPPQLGPFSGKLRRSEHTDTLQDGLKCYLQPQVIFTEVLSCPMLAGPTSELQAATSTIISDLSVTSMLLVHV